MSPPLTEMKYASLIGTANTSFGKREKGLIAGKVSTSLAKKKTTDMIPVRKKIEHSAGKENTNPAEKEKDHSAEKEAGGTMQGGKKSGRSDAKEQKSPAEKEENLFGEKKEVSDETRGTPDGMTEKENRAESFVRREIPKFRENIRDIANREYRNQKRNKTIMPGDAGESTLSTPKREEVTVFRTLTSQDFLP